MFCQIWPNTDTDTDTDMDTESASVSVSVSCWLLVSESVFCVFWCEFSLKHNQYIKKTCREWSEQLDMVDTDHFGFGIFAEPSKICQKMDQTLLPMNFP